LHHAEAGLPAGVKRGSGLAPWLDLLAHAVEGFVAVAVIVDLFVTFANALDRYFLGGGIDWADDLSGIAMPVICFLGSAVYCRRGPGMAYTAVVDRLSGGVRDALIATGLWMTIALCAGVLCVMPEFLAGQAMERLPVLGVSMAFSATWMGIGLALFALFGLEKLVRLPWRAQLAGLGAAGLQMVFLEALRQGYDAGALAADPLACILPVLVVAFLCAAPMAIVLAVGGMAFYFVTGSAPLVAAPATLQAGIGSFLLVAVPFFLAAGVLMEVTGMAGRLIDMIQEWIGHWRGGLLLAEVVSMYVFSGMSGSKAADVATVGSVMKQPLRDRGYPPAESVAVLAASAAMGEVIPPSIALLILGSVTSLSVGTLFLAGLLPAAVLAVILMLGILIRARRYGYPKGARFDLGRALRTFPPAVPALLVPVIVLGGIVGGIASPTESSSFAVVYGLAAALVFYRSVTVVTLWRAFREAAVTAGMVLLMMSAANLLSQAIVIDGVGAKLGAALAGITDVRMFLFVSMAMIVVLGFVLEGFPAILITAPLLLPIATQHGVDPLHYGILLTMAVGIGVFMPPVGIGYYIACAVGEASPHDAVKPSLFYNALLLAGLTVAILWPDIILALPRLFG
jgi:tripartite ATP-independent transporter DctM subunit